MVDSSQDGQQGGWPRYHDTSAHGLAEQVRLPADSSLKTSFHWNKEQDEIKRCQTGQLLILLGTQLLDML